MNSVIQPAVSENKRKRIVYLDVAKGVAILLVIAGHLIKSNISIIKYGSVLSNFIYSFHMPVFFVLSGMGMYLSMGGSSITVDTLKQKCKKYVRRLLLCYFVWSLISYFLSSIKGQPNTEEWFWSVITFRGRAPIWFLGALFFGEIVFILIHYFSKGKVLGCVITTLISVVMTVVCELILQRITLNSVPLKYLAIAVSRFFPVLFFICLGFLSMWILQKTKATTALCLILGVVFAVLTVVVQIKTNNEVNLHLFVLGNSFVFFFSGTFGSLALILLCKAFSSIVNLKLFAKLGENSLGIMMIHYTPFPTMKMSWLMLSYVSFLPGILIYILAIIITAAISYLATVLIKNKLLL